MQYQRIRRYCIRKAETCSKDNTCLNKGHADIVAYKGVFIYLSTCLWNQSRCICRLTEVMSYDMGVRICCSIAGGNAF
jgi:hypothetical protein